MAEVNCRSAIVDAVLGVADHYSIQLRMCELVHASSNGQKSQIQVQVSIQEEELSLGYIKKPSPCPIRKPRKAEPIRLSIQFIQFIVILSFASKHQALQC